MERPAPKANKAAWIAYADLVEQRLADSQAELASAQAAGNNTDDPELVRQLRRRVHELTRSR